MDWRSWLIPFPHHGLDWYRLAPPVNPGRRPGGLPSTLAGPRTSAVARDGLKQPVELDRLHHRTHRAEGRCLLRGPGVRGDHDDRNRRQAGIAELLGTERPPVHHRHEQIEEDQAEVGGRPETDEGLLSILRLDDTIALTFQKHRQT